MLINNVENIDYLAEVIVSHLLAGQKSGKTDVTFRLEGIFRRFFSKDVEKVTRHLNTTDEVEWEVFLHREGFYDILPEGFFHANSGKYFKEYHETIAEFRKHKEEEKNARRFFLPLEQEFYRYHLQKEMFEQEFYFAPETIREFVDFYDLDTLGLNMYQKAALFFIMPYISYITGNFKLIRTCFEIILQEQVQIITSPQNQGYIYEDEIPKLGSMALGLDSPLGNIIVDNNPKLVIEIGPLRSSESLVDFLFGTNRKLVGWLTDLFIQADLDVMVHVILNSQDKAFVLDDKNYQSRLNYSTSI